MGNFRRRSQSGRKATMAQGGSWSAGWGMLPGKLAGWSGAGEPQLRDRQTIMQGGELRAISVS